MARQTSAKFKKDPRDDRKAMITSLNHFKGEVKFPEKGFSEKAPRTQIDEFYTPFKGKEEK